MDTLGNWTYGGKGSDNVINSDSFSYKGGGASDYSYYNDTVGGGDAENPDDTDTYNSNSTLDGRGKRVWD